MADIKLDSILSKYILNETNHKVKIMHNVYNSYTHTHTYIHIHIYKKGKPIQSINKQPSAMIYTMLLFINTILRFLKSFKEYKKPPKYFFMVIFMPKSHLSTLSQKKKCLCVCFYITQMHLYLHRHLLHRAVLLYSS